MSLGRVYSHKWLLVSSAPPFMPRWISKPFRLPKTETPVWDDIQFASGLELFEGKLLVSYGVRYEIHSVGKPFGMSYVYIKRPGLLTERQVDLTLII